MKGTEAFKATIQNHLNEKAANDELFAATLKKENKSIDECIDYIIGEVQKSGKNGFADDEIYGMAVHYYDEDDLKASKASNCHVVVNHSSEEKTEKVAEEPKPKVVKEKKPIYASPSLFD